MNAKQAAKMKALKAIQSKRRNGAGLGKATKPPMKPAPGEPDADD